jgi:hypothetical protein
VDGHAALRWLALRQHPPREAVDPATAARYAEAAVDAAAAAGGGSGGAASSAPTAGSGGVADEEGGEEEEDEDYSPGGIQGRPGKPGDSCYTFWIGCSAALLGAAPLAAWYHAEGLADFLFRCQYEERGGFGKDPEATSDPMHTYYSLAGLALLLQQQDPVSGGAPAESGSTGAAGAGTAPGGSGSGSGSAGLDTGAGGLFGSVRERVGPLGALHPALGIPVYAVARLRAIHARWRDESGGRVGAAAAGSG